MSGRKRLSRQSRSPLPLACDSSERARDQLGAPPRADLARLTGKLEEERQSDRERARYHRMPDDEEAAILAVAAAGGYDSDD